MVRLSKLTIFYSVLKEQMMMTPKLPAYTAMLIACVMVMLPRYARS